VHRIGLDGLGPPPQMVLHARILAASWWPPGHPSHRGAGLVQGARTGSFLMSGPGRQASGAGIWRRGKVRRSAHPLASSSVATATTLPIGAILTTLIAAVWASRGADEDLTGDLTADA
jgi:hypothetical protein